jgi:hypothetical protein
MLDEGKDFSFIIQKKERERCQLKYPPTYARVFTVSLTIY